MAAAAVPADRAKSPVHSAKKMPPTMGRLKTFTGEWYECGDRQDNSLSLLPLHDISSAGWQAVVEGIAVLAAGDVDGHRALQAGELSGC